MQTVTSADGTEIAYDRSGDGPPLVLLHGGGTHRFWDPVVPQFEDDFTVVRPDRRGCGRSEDRSDPYALDREVEDALAVIDAVEGDPILFGHSFGGLQAIEAARRRSVEGLVAYEPAILVGEYREAADLTDRIAERLESGDRRGAMRLHLAEVLRGGDTEGFDEWLAEWPAWPDCVDDVENALRMDRAVEAYELPGRVDIGAPALLLTGTEGPSHLRDSVRAVADAVPDARLVEFDGLGHLGLASDPERVTADVRDFLADAEASDRSA